MIVAGYLRSTSTPATQTRPAVHRSRRRHHVLGADCLGMRGTRDSLAIAFVSREPGRRKLAQVIAAGWGAVVFYDSSIRLAQGQVPGTGLHRKNSPWFLGTTVRTVIRVPSASRPPEPLSAVPYQ
jgi:hypothetical protein